MPEILDGFPGIPMNVPKRAKGNTRQFTSSFAMTETMKNAMHRHPEVNWSEVCRQAIRSVIAQLEHQGEPHA